MASQDVVDDDDGKEIKEEGDSPSSSWSSPDKEKQISVDPMSLNQPPLLLPPLARPKIATASLPCSAASSPEFGSSLAKSFKKWSKQKQKPHPVLFHEQGVLLPRSKSCGEGRSSQPSDEFDILSGRDNKITARPAVLSTSESSLELQHEMNAPRCEEEEEEFKCGALCLFLPGISKKKQEQVRLQRQASRRVKAADQDHRDINHDDANEEENGSAAASRVASLERFECASWSSATILDDVEDEGVGAYFDLPLELIRGSTDDAHSPVRTAFVFERERKGVLKKSTSKSGPRNSHEATSRHVRFSTSAQVSYPASPSSGCVTPRLLQARAEFDAALLEAQKAYMNF